MTPRYGSVERGPEERYAAYTLDRYGELVELCSGDCPDAIGLGLVTMGREQMEHTGKGLGPVGILDRGESPGVDPGKWLVSAWPDRGVR